MKRKVPPSGGLNGTQRKTPTARPPHAHRTDTADNDNYDNYDNYDNDNDDNDDDYDDDDDALAAACVLAVSIFTLRLAARLRSRC